MFFHCVQCVVVLLIHKSRSISFSDSKKGSWFFSFFLSFYFKSLLVYVSCNSELQHETCVVRGIQITEG